MPIDLWQFYHTNNLLYSHAAAVLPIKYRITHKIP